MLHQLGVLGARVFETQLLLHQLGMGLTEGRAVALQHPLRLLRGGLFILVEEAEHGVS